MGTKKILAAVALTIVIVAAVVFIVRASSPRSGAARAPAWVTEDKVEKIDVETGGVSALTQAEWTSLGAQDGKYKSPKSGKYTMSAVIVCASCGAKVPAPAVQRGPEGMKALLQYKCPRCGKAVVKQP